MTDQDTRKRGRSLNLFFVDGSPQGMLTAKIPNWTGHVLRTPRESLTDALARNEAQYPGVYLLLGAEEDSGEAMLYVGESEDMAKRIRQHDGKRDWWDVAVLITTTDKSLHKGSIKYLESNLLKKAREIGKAKLENRQASDPSPLSKAEIDDMESFLDNLMVVLPAIRVDLFEEEGRVVHTDKEDKTPNQTTFVIERKRGIKAEAKTRLGEAFILLKGSLVRPEWTGKGESYGKRKHKQLVERGIIKVEGEKATMMESYEFRSPSMAADIVLGRNSNGRKEWKLKSDNAITYEQWRAEELGKE